MVTWWSPVVTGLPRNAFQFDWFPQEEVAPASKYIYKCTCQMSKETTNLMNLN